MQLWRKAGGSVEQSGRQGKAVKDMSAAQVSLHGKEVRIDVTRPGSLCEPSTQSPLRKDMASLPSYELYDIPTRHFTSLQYLHVSSHPGTGP